CEHPANCSRSSGSTPTPTPERTDAVSQRPDRSRPPGPGPGPAAAATAPIAERARKVLANPYDGRYSRPSTWPEVQRIAAAWSTPFGIREVKLRDDVGTDPDLKAILAALADDYDPDVLVALGEHAARAEVAALLARPLAKTDAPALDPEPEQEAGGTHGAG